MRNSTENSIKDVLKKYPELNHFGFGVFKGNKLSADERKKKIISEQDALLKNADEVQYAIEWLSDVAKIKSFNNNHSSYGLKHLCEKTSPKGYISNGSFITGAIIAGFKVKRLDANAHFNMSEKSLKAKEALASK